MTNDNNLGNLYDDRGVYIGDFDSENPGCEKPRVELNLYKQSASIMTYRVRNYQPCVECSGSQGSHFGLAECRNYTLRRRDGYLVINKHVSWGGDSEEPSIDSIIQIYKKQDQAKAVCKLHRKAILEARVLSRQLKIHLVSKGRSLIKN